MPEVLPTVGRVVYFKSDMLHGEVAEYAAIVVKVYSPTQVSLAVFSEEGITFEKQVEQGSEVRNWDWMQFQKDQAARLAPGTPIAQPAGQPTLEANGTGEPTDPKEPTGEQPSSAGGSDTQTGTAPVSGDQV